jgi:hypothetical protein
LGEGGGGLSPPDQYSWRRRYMIPLLNAHELRYQKKSRLKFNIWMPFFSRQMKAISRLIYDRWMLDKFDINMSERNKSNEIFICSLGS